MVFNKADKNKRMKMKRRMGGRLASAALAICLLAGNAQAVFAGDTVYVNCDVLRCRSSAEIKDGNIVKNVYYGDKLERVESKGEWTVVMVNGKKCYVSSQYLSASNPKGTPAPAAASGNSGTASTGGAQISVSSDWKYADFSKIKSGSAVLYKTASSARKNKTVCVNAGHGTSGGGSVKTQCHPDGTPKVTGGTTGAGATEAAAVSSGMTFNDGTAEANVTLALARILKEKLLSEGYDVLMIRESEDVQLDNIARTVLANNKADCHIALHWDSTANDKGAFYMSVPNVDSYRAMEPVASHWEQHNRLGEALVQGLKGAGVKIFSEIGRASCRERV